MRNFAKFLVLGTFVILMGLIFGASGLLFCATMFTGFLWFYTVWQGIKAVKDNKATLKKSVMWLLLVLFIIPACGLYLGFWTIAILFV